MSVPEGSKIILRTEVGSRVHGIAVKGTDDRDEMEIVVPPTSHVLGLREFSSCMPRTAPDGQRSEPGHLDLVSHSLRKYCGLALKGNPSVPYFSTTPTYPTRSTQDTWSDWVSRESNFWKPGTSPCQCQRTIGPW